LLAGGRPDVVGRVGSGSAALGGQVVPLVVLCARDMLETSVTGRGRRLSRKESERDAPRSFSSFCSSSPAPDASYSCELRLPPDLGLLSAPEPAIDAASSVEGSSPTMMGRAAPVSVSTAKMSCEQKADVSRGDVR